MPFIRRWMGPLGLPCPRRSSLFCRCRALLGVTLVLVAVEGCSITLVSAYDEQIDRAATELQRRMDRHLTRLAVAIPSEATFQQHATFYERYAVDLRSVKVRAEAHPKNRISIRQYGLMEVSLEDLRSTHEAEDGLSHDYAITVRDLFNQAWRSIIALEVAKKRGDG